MSEEIKTQLLVLGGGPGGYSAAFRWKDLNPDQKALVVDLRDTLGGVCLNVGCIPSKALLHAAKVIDEAADMSQHGIQFSSPKINAKALRNWKNDVIAKLTQGLSALAKQRKVDVMEGKGRFLGPNRLEVQSGKKKQIVVFEQAIIAAGSEPAKLPFMPDDPRILDSTGALELNRIKGTMLIVGGGIIGLEMGTVYRALGVKVTVVELRDQLIPGCDPSVVLPLQKRLKSQFADIYLKTQVTQVEAKKNGLWVTFSGDQAPKDPQSFDQILVAVGRRPNGKLIQADKAGIQVDAQGFITVDRQLRTSVPHILAIGDIIGNPMLAHKATYEAHVAAEVLSGKKHTFDAKCIPSVAYTDPELAWVGMTEAEARTKGVACDKGVFPWVASGRSLSMNRTEGLTQLLVDKSTGRVIGGAIVGPNAGELIAEIALAIEMGCDIQDIALTVHPHPTLSESIMLAAQMYEGTITDLIASKKRK